jgi:flagellar basal body L-ring protein FlgH
MKNLIVVLAVLALSGCSTIVGWVPSFNDSNQSQKIVDVRMAVDSLDCSQPQHVQAVVIQRELRWFELYSESKGIRNQDVIRIIKPMQASVSEFVDRTRDKDASKIYCDLKKRAMQEQAARAAGVILGRF